MCLNLGADIAQRVCDDQYFAVELPLGDLKAHPGFPRHCAAVLVKRPAALAHKAVAGLLSEEVGEIRNDAGMAHYISEWPDESA